MQCTAGASRPCCVCPQCRKVLDDTHPDVVTVDDTEHKGVSVRIVRDARADLFIRPNEGRRKVYLFPRAADLNAAGQNSLLKVLEEPPSYGAFLLLTDAAQKLLPTIRSRCVELELAPLSRAVCLAALRRLRPDAANTALEAAYLRSGGFLGQALQSLSEGGGLRPQTETFAQVYRERDELGLAALLTSMERLKRDQLQPILAEWLELLEAALAARNGLPPTLQTAAQIGQTRSGTELLSAIAQLRRGLELLQANVAPGTLLGALLVYLR